MKIQPIASPNQIKQVTTNEGAAKAKAIAAFNQAAQAPQPVVQNQNAIAPEELSAIQPQERRDDTSESTQEAIPVVETPVVEATKPPEQDPELTKQFDQLARQEKMLRAKAQQQDQALKAREAAIAAREAELAGKPQFDPKQYYTKDQVKQNALDVLAEAGVSYEELTQQIISQQPVDPRLQSTINQLKDQIAQLKQESEMSKKSYADQQTQAYQAAVKQIRTDVNQLVYTDPNFETIKATKSAKDVVDLIEQTYHRDGVLLSTEEAAQLVEDHLVERYTKIAQIDKIKRKLPTVAPKAMTSTAQTPAANTKQPQPMKTLTNATSSSRQLSAKERAILAFKGELKS